MIIWNGHGILVILFAILGLFLGFEASALLENAGMPARFGPVVGIWGAALMALLYAKTMGRTTEMSLFDPKTKRPVTLKNRHTLFFIPVFVWAMVLIILAILMSIAFFTMPDLEPDESRGRQELADSSESQDPPSTPSEKAPTSSEDPVKSESPPSPEPALPTAVRDWQAADGRTMRAALLRFTDEDGQSAEFEREDGQTFMIPVRRFSVESRAELRKIFESGIPGDRAGDSP